MSAREWKPGDVALVKVAMYDKARIMLRTETGWDDGGESYWAGATGDWAIEEAHPLVVIDPEDVEQVERLRRAILGPLATAHDLDDFAQALREFANPTPPKPAEPTGLGAVVEDGAGVKWIRSGAAFSDPNWQRCGGNEWTEWTDIDAVRILSEGVPS